MKEKNIMKAIKYLFISLAAFALASCMNDHDEPDSDFPAYGNNYIGAPNMSITEFKTKYKSAMSNTAPTEITDNVIIKGVVVCNDETGNIYKQIVINDNNDAMLISVDDVGMYATLPRGQMVAIDCKGLCVGAYGKLPQIGLPYTNKYGEEAIGRMNKDAFEQHIKLIGTPNPYYSELVPVDLTAEFLSDDSNKDLLPRYVRLKGVSFEEADGKNRYAPEEEVQNSAVERTVKIGGKNIIFRLSSYADFANEILPKGTFDIVGVLTRYNNYWQFMLSSTADITPAE